MSLSGLMRPFGNIIYSLAVRVFYTLFLLIFAQALLVCPTMLSIQTSYVYV